MELLTYDESNNCLSVTLGNVSDTKEYLVSLSILGRGHCKKIIYRKMSKDLPNAGNLCQQINFPTVIKSNWIYT